MVLRSPVKRAARFALLPAAVVVAAASFVHAASEIGALPVNPGASGMFGLNANALAKQVDREFEADLASGLSQTGNEFPQMPKPLVALARASFAVDPLEVSSLRTIALGSVLQTDKQRARRIMRLADRISQRDDVTNLWLAQDYGKLGDQDAMMGSFDRALRTSPRVRDVAIKPIVEMLGSKDSYRPLGKLLAHRPEWENAFWGAFAQNPISVANAANFFAGSGIPIDQLSDGARRALYANLKRSGLFDSLSRLAALDPGAKAGAEALSAGKFATTSEGYPFGWTLYSRGDASAQVHQATGELQIDSGPGSFGIATDRIAPVKGHNDLAIAMAEPVPDYANVKLTVNCADGAKQELGAIALRPGDKGGTISFAAGACAFAKIALSFAIEPGRNDALIRVTSITLRPN